MHVWFVPTHRGDIRLEAAENGSILEIENPSPNEKQILERFVTACREKGWLQDVSPLGSVERVQRVVLAQSVQDVGPLLCQAALGDGDVWTVIRRKDGRIELADGSRVEGTAVAAATIKPPQRGCPPPEPCNARASEVLRSFCTVSQWAEWNKTRSLVALGSVTGRPYRIFHRNEAVRRGLGHILTDYRGKEVCVWDGSVPAEEEVLGAKLAVEHREWWIAEAPGAMLSLDR